MLLSFASLPCFGIVRHHSCTHMTDSRETRERGSSSIKLCIGPSLFRSEQLDMALPEDISDTRLIYSALHQIEEKEKFKDHYRDKHTEHSTRVRGRPITELQNPVVSKDRHRYEMCSRSISLFQRIRFSVEHGSIRIIHTDWISIAQLSSVCVWMTAHNSNKFFWST